MKRLSEDDIARIKTLYEKFYDKSITLNSKINIIQYISLRLDIDFKNTKDFKHKMEEFNETHSKV